MIIQRSMDCINAEKGAPADTMLTARVVTHAKAIAALTAEGLRNSSSVSFFRFLNISAKFDSPAAYCGLVGFVGSQNYCRIFPEFFNDAVYKSFALLIQSKTGFIKK